MARIYSQAKRVVAWLGRLEQEIDSVQGSSSAKEAADFLFYLAKCTVQRQNRESQPWRQDALNCIRGYPQPSCWTSILNLSLRTYWTRLWIIQECLRASTLVFQCDKVQIPGEDTVEAFRQLDFLNWYFDIRGDIPIPLYYATAHNQLVSSNMYNIVNQRDSFSGRSLTSRTLYTTILTYQRSECQVLFDKAFGLLGVALPCCRESLPVEYTMSSQQLCYYIRVHQLTNHTTAYNDAGMRKIEDIFMKGEGVFPERLGGRITFNPYKRTAGPFLCHFMGIILKNQGHDQIWGNSRVHITLLFLAEAGPLKRYQTPDNILENLCSLRARFGSTKEELDEIGLSARLTAWLLRVVERTHDASKTTKTDKCPLQNLSATELDSGLVAMSSQYPHGNVCAGDLVYHLISSPTYSDVSSDAIFLRWDGRDIIHAATKKFEFVGQGERMLLDNDYRYMENDLLYVEPSKNTLNVNNLE